MKTTEPTLCIKLDETQWPDMFHIAYERDRPETAVVLDVYPLPTDEDWEQQYADIMARIEAGEGEG